MSDLSDFLTSVARFFVKIYFHKKCGVFETCKKVTDFFDTLKKASADGGSFFMANDSNFDRNPVRGVQLRFRGGCSSRFRGCNHGFRGCITLPVGTAINRRR